MARTDLSYASNATVNNQFERLGHPGRYTSALTYSGGQLDFTGSNYGYGAVLVNAAGAATGSLSGGGTIALGQLDAGVVHEFSLKQISGGTINSNITIFKRQQ